MMRGISCSKIYEAGHIHLNTGVCHWRELLQVSFLSWQNGSFVTTKVCLSWQNFCCKKHIFVATNTVLSRQNFCCDKLIFIVTNMCSSWQNRSFVATKLCLLQQNCCHDRHMFVAENICRDKCFVATKIFCHDKHNFVTTKAYFFRDKRHVLLRQTCLLRQNFVATEMVLIAAPANDRSEPQVTVHPTFQHSTTWWSLSKACETVTVGGVA